MKNLKRFLTWLFTSMFKKHVEIDTQTVRRFLYQYFIDTSDGFEYQVFSYAEQYISDVKVYKKDIKTILVVLKSKRPGMLIGKAGGTFNDIKEKLETELKTSVEIEIVEDKIWQNLY